jgi:hypothetical protein
MPFKPNYRFERSQREHLKKAKKDEKLCCQQVREATRANKDLIEIDGAVLTKS